MYFHEQVSNLQRASNKWQCNDVVLKMVTCQVANNLNVFRASMKDRSVGNLNENFVITMHRSWINTRIIK